VATNPAIDIKMIPHGQPRQLDRRRNEWESKGNEGVADNRTVGYIGDSRWTGVRFATSDAASSNNGLLLASWLSR